MSESEPTIDLSAYATIMAELAVAGEDQAARALALERRGLDEDAWDAIDSAWQARIEEAMDDDSDGVHPLIAEYASAYEAAQRATSPPISLEQFAHVTRVFQASGDIRAALIKAGVTLAAYIQGAEHWSRQIAADPDLERRFEDALRGG